MGRLFQQSNARTIKAALVTILAAVVLCGAFVLFMAIARTSSDSANCKVQSIAQAEEAVRQAFQAQGEVLILPGSEGSDLKTRWSIPFQLNDRSRIAEVLCDGVGLVRDKL